VEQWSVGGTNIGPLYTFEVFDMPSSFTRSVGASSPDVCGSSYTPPGGVSFSTLTYGPSASVEYQVVGSSGSNETTPDTGLNIMMEPQESFGGGAYVDIGCSGSGCNSGWLWTPPSSQYASSGGVFYDVPFADCENVPFSNFAFPTQTIGIKIGNNLYPVGSNSETSSSSSPGQGTFTGSFSYSQ
jgi:hypothetical protein